MLDRQYKTMPPPIFISRSPRSLQRFLGRLFIILVAVNIASSTLEFLVLQISTTTNDDNSNAIEESLQAVHGVKLLRSRRRTSQTEQKQKQSDQTSLKQRNLIINDASTAEESNPLTLLLGSDHRADITKYSYFAHWSHALCGASLIAPDLLLTAAHCGVTDNPLELKSVQLLSPIRGVGGITRVVVYQESHPGFNKNTWEFDFQILKLDRSALVTYPGDDETKEALAAAEMNDAIPYDDDLDDDNDNTTSNSNNVQETIKSSLSNVTSSLLSLVMGSNHTSTAPTTTMVAGHHSTIHHHAFHSQPTGAKIVQLNTDYYSPTVGEPLTAVGFGVVATGDKSNSEYLMDVQFHRFQHAICESQYGHGRIPDETMMCMGVEGGGKDVCAGTCSRVG